MIQWVFANVITNDTFENRRGNFALPFSAYLADKGLSGFG
jgi:hypothetical protein